MFGLKTALFTNPWALALEGLAILALVFGIFHAGEKFERTDWLVKEAAADKLLAIQTRKAQDSADKYATVQLQFDAFRAAKLKEATQHAEAIIAANPAYGTCRLDDDGLRLWNSLTEPDPAGGPGNGPVLPVRTDPALPRNGPAAQEPSGNRGRVE